MKMSRYPSTSPWWLRVALPLALALWVAPVAQAQTADRLEGQIPEEVEAFRATAERFDLRMAEVDADTRDFVALREEEERVRLTGGYDATIDNLHAIEESQRQLTIDRFEEFLTAYPDARYSSHVRFRLADLYYEIAQIEFLNSTEAYFEALESEDLELLENLGDEPRKDLSKSIALYQQIIEDNLSKPPDERYERLDGVYLMLGFCYFDETSAQLDEVLAKQAYEDLIRELPDSEYADRSHLALGNFLFAEGAFEAAIGEYQRVYDKGTEGPKYVDAMYQLAWAHYKQNRFDEATSMFLTLLDLSVEKERESGRESPYAPDSLKYMAYAFADMANQDLTDSVDVAANFFANQGERSYEWEIYVELADVLMRYFRFDEAIQVYERLQTDPRWIDRPENPGFQIAIVNLYARPEVGDLVRSGEARLLLTDRYNEGSAWWEANRSNPDALQKARDFIESSLLDVAIEYYVRATESGSTEDFMVAASKYQEYLDKFPIADDYYDQQWFLANAYRQGLSWTEAEREFDRLLASSKYHPYGDGAIYFLMEARLKQMTDTSGEPGVPPVGADVLEELAGQDGTQIPVYALSEDRQAFIEAADAVLNHEFQPYDASIEGLPDIGKAVDEKRAALTYIPAQILFHHNHLDAARERCLDLIDNHPRSIEASYAAGLLVDSYIATGDLESVRLYTKRFATTPPGPPSDTPDDKFLATLEGTTFKLALQRAEDEDFDGAADAFLDFLDEFPSSEYAPDALHNAAFYYQEVGKKERANELYEQFVMQYPSDDKSRKLYFRIASNYEATFELEKAVDYYDQLRRRFPDDANAEAALYNASFLRIGLGQHEQAAKGFERYARDFPDATDREEVHWMAGAQWEEVSDAKALNFYKGYLRNYGTENPDHAMEAQNTIAEIYLSQGNNRQHAKQLDAIIETFNEVSAAGGEIGGLGHRYAAASEIRYLIEAYEDLTDEELVGDEDKDGVLLRDVKPAEVKEFEAKTKGFIAKYRSFHENTGAAYLHGMSVLYLADLGLSIRPPPGLSEEEGWAFMDLLQEKVFPQYYELEEYGIRLLTELIDAAKKQKKHSEWINKAYAELNRREPLDYPDIKDEILGVPDPAVPTYVRPLARTPDDVETESSTETEPPPVEEPPVEESPVEEAPVETEAPSDGSEGGE